MGLWGSVTKFLLPLLVSPVVLTSKTSSSAKDRFVWGIPCESNIELAHSASPANMKRFLVRVRMG